MDSLVVVVVTTRPLDADIFSAWAPMTMTYCVVERLPRLDSEEYSMTFP